MLDVGGCHGYLLQVVKDYLRLAVQYDNAWENSKFNVMTTWHLEQTTEHGIKLRTAKGLRAMCAVLGMEEEHDAIIDARKARAATLGIEFSRQFSGGSSGSVAATGWWWFARSLWVVERDPSAFLSFSSGS